LATRLDEKRQRKTDERILFEFGITQLLHTLQSEINDCSTFYCHSEFEPEIFKDMLMITEGS